MLREPNHDFVDRLATVSNFHGFIRAIRKNAAHLHRTAFGAVQVFALRNFRL